MAKKLRLGLVGADAAGKGWAPIAHIPALRGLQEVELVAVCTTRPESAAAAAAAYGVEGAFHDVGELAAHPGVDAVAVVVRAASHREAVLASLARGKPTFCEWPLGTSLAQTEAMAALAQQAGVTTGVGLQGRATPALRYLRELVETGWVGELLSVDVVATAGGQRAPPREEDWRRERAKGAHFFNIVGGHTLDTLLFCAGPLSEVTARVSTMVERVHFADTGNVAELDTPDSLLFHGALAGGGLVSYRGAALPCGPSRWQMELNGTEGRLVATAPGLPQIAPVELRGAKGQAELALLTVPGKLDPVPRAVQGPARNVAGLYQGFAAAILEGARFEPDFAHALTLHRLLEALVLSSSERRAVEVRSLLGGRA